MEGPHSHISHAGELEMRKRFANPLRLTDDKLSRMVDGHVDSSLAGFIEKQPFFFISTASDTGACDANFRARDVSETGRPQPLLLLKDSQNLLFPDFAGNGFYNSLGNIHLNPHIGLLFIDFQDQRRARINGNATVIDLDDATREIWPNAQAIVHVQVTEAYANCSARIPKLKAYSNPTKMVRLGGRRR